MPRGTSMKTPGTLNCQRGIKTEALAASLETNKGQTFQKDRDHGASKRLISVPRLQERRRPNRQQTPAGTSRKHIPPEHCSSLRLLRQKVNKPAHSSKRSTGKELTSLSRPSTFTTKRQQCPSSKANAPSKPSSSPFPPHSVQPTATTFTGGSSPSPLPFPASATPHNPSLPLLRSGRSTKWRLNPSSPRPLFPPSPSPSPRPIPSNNQPSTTSPPPT